MRSIFFQIHIYINLIISLLPIFPKRKKENFEVTQCLLNKMHILCPLFKTQYFEGENACPGYRTHSIKRRGVYEIFSVSDAAFIQGWRLFEGGVYFKIIFLKSLIIITVNHSEILCKTRNMFKVPMSRFFAEIES